jgi:hypothetical protein
MNWIIKLVAAIIVWVIVAVLLAFVGGLLATVNQTQIAYLGAFLKASSSILGFLAGAAYFIWGRVPVR